LAILQNSPAPTHVIGIDRDPESILLARERLAPFSNRLHLIHGKFGDIKDILFHSGFEAVEGILLDLGFSSFQLEGLERGFSFQRDDPLDMRMDRSQGRTAREWLARAKEKELAQVLRQYGEERWANRIAKKVTGKAIETTRELADRVAEAIPRKYWPKRLHPATRTFQALRILVNDELAQLQNFLKQFIGVLNPGGRVCLLSYHSLEDRLIKEAFLKLERGTPDGQIDPGLSKTPERPVFKRINPKPWSASPEEIRENPRARSAKMRVGERLS
jgi:16S rRNA (cytosine1402-N4)-methyltransferase